MPREVLSKDGICCGCDYCKAYFEHSADAKEHEERYHSDEEVPKYAVGDFVGFDGTMYLVRDYEWCKRMRMYIYSIGKYCWFNPNSSESSRPFAFSYNVMKVYEHDIVGKINKEKLIATATKILTTQPVTAARVEIIEGHEGAYTQFMPVIHIGLGDEQ